MAEFGAFKDAQPTIAGAASALKNWRVGGCTYGVRGWLLWTWDTPQASSEIWNATADDGSIGNALA